MSDLINDFIKLTEPVIAPDIFRLWSGISLVAGALERRVWLRNEMGNVYPNLYVLLVAPPGTGKSIVERVRELWDEACEPNSKIPALHVAPDSMTKASLIDTLSKAKSNLLPPEGAFFSFHALNIAAEEFGVLLPAYDMEFVGTLNALWNNKRTHREVRRTGARTDITIENPTLNILGGAQPAWLASVFPFEAWDTGIGRRLLMIYGPQAPWKDIWAQGRVQDGLRESILKRIGELSLEYGQLDIEHQVIEYLRAWDQQGQEPRPTHSKLIHYLSTRYQTLMKLCIVSAMSRGEKCIILQDLERAMDWLFAAEAAMPDIFRAMVGKSDRDVIGELHMFIVAAFARNKAKPVSGELLRRFLLDRLPHDKVESMMLTCERANIINRVANTTQADLYVPGTRGADLRTVEEE